MTATVAAPAALRSPASRLLRRVLDMALGTLLCTNPFTAVFALGWLMRRMRWIALPGEEQPGWVMMQSGSGLRRLLGGLAANTREGIGGAGSLLIATLPFTGLFALLWWAGWNNSFTKGYEQAALAPVVSLVAAAASLPVITYLPMALAHQAVTQRWKAFFAWREVMALIARAPWRYAGVLILLAAASALVMVFRVVPVFAQSIWPELADADAAQMAAVRLNLTLAYGATVFLSAWLLRSLSARCYAVARARLDRVPPRLAWRAAAWSLYLAAALIIVIQIYIAQFFNYSNVRWFLQPHLLLPAAT